MQKVTLNHSLRSSLHPLRRAAWRGPHPSSHSLVSVGFFLCSVSYFIYLYEVIIRREEGEKGVFFVLQSRINVSHDSALHCSGTTF